MRTLVIVRIKIFRLNDLQEILDKIEDLKLKTPIRIFV